MTNIISIAQIVISVLLMTAILLQQRGTGSSAIMGGSSASYYTKRGFEKVLFVSTIVLVILFLAAAIANIFLS